MRLLALLSLIFLLPAHPAMADRVHTLRVFHTNAIKVDEDWRLPAGLTIQVYNLETKNNATDRLNRMVKDRLDPASGSLGEAHEQAFGELLNSPHWTSLYRELEAGGEAIETAIRFRIQKLPAIVLNDRAVIYGVTSLREAIRIYQANTG